MPKIVLDNIASGYNLAKFNENFQRLENELNNKVLYRDNPEGEPNHMTGVLDMNSNRIFNVADGVVDSDGVNLGQVRMLAGGGGGGGGSSTIIQAEAPANPEIGTEWIRCTDLKSFVWYVDTQGGQWIETGISSGIVIEGGGAITYDADDIAETASRIWFTPAYLSELNNKLTDAPSDGTYYARRDGGWTSFSLSGAGDMLSSVYDPQNIAGDVFNRANHTGTQSIATINGLQVAIDGKEDVGVAAAGVASHVAQLDPHTQYAKEADLALVATSGDYLDLINTPTTGLYDYPQEKYTSLGTVSGTVNINVTNGSLQKLTIGGVTTLSFDFSAVTANHYSAVILDITNGGSASVTWTSVLWDGGTAPVLQTAGKDRVVITYDGVNLIGSISNEDYQ